MGKKKKKKKTGGSAAEQIAQRIESKGPGDLSGLLAETGLSAEEAGAAFESALEMRDKGPDPRKLIELPPAFQAAFLRIAEADEDDDLIGDLLEMTTAKEVRKEAKRTLHRMRSRGVEVDLPSESGQSVLERVVEVEQKPLPCYLSPVSGIGGRMIFMARYTQGGVAVYQGEYSDSDGLTQFAGGTIGRNRYKQLSQQMLSDPSGQLLEVEFAEARAVLARAVERCREAGKSPPEEYLEASGELGEVDPSAAPPDPSTVFPAEAVAEEPGLVESAAELLDLPELADWIPDEQTIQAIDEKIKEVEAGQVTINDQQRVEQVQRAIEAGPATLLEGEDKRKLFHERLLETAVYFQRTGREAQARAAAATGWQILAEDFDPSTSPFFSKMVTKLFRSADEIVAHMPKQGEKATEPEDAPSSGNLIIPP